MNLAAAATGSVDITLRVDGSLTGTLTNWSEIFADDGDDKDSTPDGANGTTGESIIDNEINNGSGDEDDHDRADIIVTANCGDGVINQSSEQCDDGNTGNNDGCSDICVYETPTCTLTFNPNTGEPILNTTGSWT
jgi:cysteine-rich repeat protein